MHCSSSIVVYFHTVAGWLRAAATFFVLQYNINRAVEFTAK